MEKQLKVQICWDAIIEKGLLPSTALEVKAHQSARQKWEYLKRRFLKSSNARKAPKVMKMANWTWDRSKHNERTISLVVSPWVRR